MIKFRLYHRDDGEFHKYYSGLLPTRYISATTNQPYGIRFQYMMSMFRLTLYQSKPSIESQPQLLFD